MASQRRMNIGMQMAGLGQMIAGSRYDTDTIDTRSLIDRTLSYGENRENIGQQLGINRRNRAQEEYEQREAQARSRMGGQQVRDAPESWLGLYDEDVYQETHSRAAPPFRQIDKGRCKNQCLPPGKRMSATGNIYYERRRYESRRP